MGSLGRDLPRSSHFVAWKFTRSSTRRSAGRSGEHIFPADLLFVLVTSQHENPCERLLLAPQHALAHTPECCPE